MLLWVLFRCSCFCLHRLTVNLWLHASLQHGHQGNPIVHTWGRGKLESKEIVHESNWKWLDASEAVRDNLSIFGSQRVNLMLGIGTKTKLEAEHQEEIWLMRSSLFGLGTKRTLEQAVEFSGINLKERKMAVNRCGNLEWVPFEESPDYGVGETLSRGFAGEEVPPFVVTPDVHGAGSGAAVMGAASAGVAKGLRSAASPGAASSSITGDYRVLGGLIVVAILIVRLSTRKQWKDDKHKN